MTFNYNVTGADRKSLVHAIRSIMGAPAKYLGAPSFAYEVDYLTIDKNGCVSFDDRADSEEIETLVERLLEMGFCPEPNEAAEAENTEEEAPYSADTAVDSGFHGICVSMPGSMVDERTQANLLALLAAKGNLIRKALGVTELSILTEGDKVSFPWFKGETTAEEVKAYDAFICKLCEMARTQQRITAKEKEVDNEKYAFRCFLLRLGFIGEEYKAARKILLRNLTGSSAFKGAEVERPQCGMQRDGCPVSKGESRMAMSEATIANCGGAVNAVSE